MQYAYCLVHTLYIFIKNQYYNLNVYSRILYYWRCTVAELIDVHLNFLKLRVLIFYATQTYMLWVVCNYA